MALWSPISPQDARFGTKEVVRIVLQVKNRGVSDSGYRRTQGVVA